MANNGNNTERHNGLVSRLSSVDDRIDEIDCNMFNIKNALDNTNIKNSTDNDTEDSTIISK